MRRVEERGHATKILVLESMNAELQSKFTELVSMNAELVSIAPVFGLGPPKNGGETRRVGTCPTYFKKVNGAMS